MAGDRRSVIYALAALAALLTVGCLEQNLTLTIKPDGTCTVTCETTYARNQVEQHVKLLEGSAASAADEAPAEAPGEAPTGVPGEAADEAGAESKEAEAAAAEALAARIRKLHAAQNQSLPIASKLEAVVVQNETVRTVITASFATVKDMLPYASNVWRQAGFSEIALSKDDAGNLKLTFSVPRSMRGYSRSIASGLKTSQFKGTSKFVMPGKIVASSLPETKDNETWIAIDATKGDTLEKLRQLQKAAVVITFETGGLTLTGLPYSSKPPEPTRVPQQVEPDIPITDAGPGFLAEATNLTVTTEYRFPEGAKHFKEEDDDDDQGRRQGVDVNARLFAPKGRGFLAFSGVRVVEAIDDRGRPVLPAKSEPGPPMNVGNAEQLQECVTMRLRLKLPEPGAEMIGPLRGEVIATTHGRWQELVVPELEADPKKQIDLSDILPGAKMAIAAVQQKGKRGSVDLKIVGPTTIRQLRFVLRRPGIRRLSTYSQSDSSTTAGDQTTRSLTIAYHAYRSPGTVPVGTMSLIARYPGELRRERVKFVLEELDLF